MGRYGKTEPEQRGARHGRPSLIIERPRSTLESMTGMRVLLFDRTCREIAGRLGLTTIWSAGARLFRWQRRFDVAWGISTWKEGLHSLARHEAPRSISEVHFWGHGTWGQAWVGQEALSVESLEPGHVHFESLRAIRDRHLPDGSTLWWFRTCDTLGTARGHAFARRFASFMDATVAGHTFTIAWAHSGLRCLRPGQEPDWGAQEGLRGECKRSAWSSFGKPRTIPFWKQEIPSEWRPNSTWKP